MQEITSCHASIRMCEKFIVSFPLRLRCVILQPRKCMVTLVIYSSRCYIIYRGDVNGHVSINNL